MSQLRCSPKHALNHSCNGSLSITKRREEKSHRPQRENAASVLSSKSVALVAVPSHPPTPPPKFNPAVRRCRPRRRFLHTDIANVVKNRGAGPTPPLTLLAVADWVSRRHSLAPEHRTRCAIWPLEIQSVSSCENAETNRPSKRF